jgi:hypothetical protein
MTCEARPYLLPAPGRLDALSACVQQMLPELSRDWWREADRVQLVGVSALDDELRASPLRLLVRESSQAWLALLGTHEAWRKLAEGWLDCEVPAAGPLVETLQREFCLALYRRLGAREAAVAVVLETADWSQVPASALRAGAGTIVLELDVEGIPLTLVAPIALWPEFAGWPQGERERPTHEVVDALGDAQVRVDVRLPAVRVAMTDVASLAAGDFLDLQQDLTGLVRVVGSNVDVDLAADLGRQGAHKAIRIEKRNGGQQ